jgi:hypothetical protein
MSSLPLQISNAATLAGLDGEYISGMYNVSSMLQNVSDTGKQTSERAAGGASFVRTSCPASIVA